MGHRIPDHKSKCKNLHGHTYFLEIYVEGRVIEEEGSDKGMVQDFGDLKEIMMKKIHDKLDHNFIWYEKDDFLEYLRKKDTWNKTTGTIIGVQIGKQVDFIPTAENIAKWCYEQIKDVINNDQRKLIGVKLWETPTSTAYYGDDKR